MPSPLRMPDAVIFAYLLFQVYFSPVVTNDTSAPPLTAALFS
jgi:hypothetical protein